MTQTARILKVDMAGRVWTPREQREARLDAYLQREYPTCITTVVVEARRIMIQGKAASDVMLAGIRPELDVSGETLDSASLDLHPLTLHEQAFTVLLPRMDSDMDRIYLKWALVTVRDGRAKLVSAAKYATDLSAASASQYPADAFPSSKKGLAGISALEPNLADALQLGTQHTNVNLVIDDLLALAPGPGIIAFKSAGKTYYIRNGRYLRYTDALCQWAAQHHVRVSGIVLIRRLAANDPLRVLLNHPDTCEPGKFALPNLKTRTAVEHYTAVLEFLAQRYSRPDQKYGRIHNWVAHNETDASWVWTNAGRQLMGSYMDDNIKSMRLIHHAAHKCDGAAPVRQEPAALRWVEATVEEAKVGAVRTLTVHLPGGARMEVGDAGQAVLAAQLLRTFGGGGSAC